MELAFDPLRIERLAGAVLEAIDALADCRCDDVAAADAMRVLRLTRQNLEEQWMPLLRGVRTSGALTSWLPVFTGGAATELIALFARRPMTTGFDREVHAAVVAAQMRALLGDPAACLDVLADPYTLVLLATWGDLPDDLVERFVVAGLHDAVVADATRSADALRVLATLTRQVNDVADGALRPGLTRGVARALDMLAPRIAPALRREADGYPVIVFDGDGSMSDEAIELGAYDDLVDLVGALLRDEEAAAEVGRALGRYTVSAVGDAGADVATSVALGHVAEFTDLVTDAARAEQAELVAEAAARASWVETFGSSIRLATGVALTAAGVGAVSRLVTDRAMDAATGAITDRIDPDAIHGAAIDAAVHELIVTTVVRNAVTRHDVRAGLGLDDVTEPQWQMMRAHLAAIDAAPDASARTAAALRLEWWIDANVPALGGVLADVKAAPALHELTESRAGFDPDDDG